MKKRVLIMSGTILNDDILALEAAGLEVVTAQNYPQGLERLDETSPDLVIIDEMLPVVNGWEACSRLRQISDIPIILLSADRSGQAVARAINQGVDTYIFKSVSSRELEAREDKMGKCTLCEKKLGRISYSKGELEFCSQGCVREYEDQEAGRSSYCAICGKKATGWLRFVEDGFTFCYHGCLTKYRDRKRKGAV